MRNATNALECKNNRTMKICFVIHKEAIRMVLTTNVNIPNTIMVIKLTHFETENSVY